MSYKKSLINASLKLSKYIFYEHTYEFLLFMHTLTILRIVQIMYKIKDFSYTFNIGLYFIGILIYELRVRLFAARRRRLLFLVLTFLFIVLSAFAFRTVMIRGANLLIENNRSIQTAFYNSKDSYFFQYVPLLTILLPTVTASALYLASKGLDNIILLLSVIFIFNLWYAAELNEVKAYMAIYAIIVMLSYGRTKIINTIRRLEAEGIKSSVNFKHILQHVLILSCTVGIFAFVSVQTFGAKDVFTRIQDRREKSLAIQERSFAGIYNLSTSGYPDSSVRLGGPINLNYNKAFMVQADEPHYLKGSTKDFYDGFRWIKTEEKYDKLSESPQYYQTRSFEKAQVKKLIIYPENLQVSTLFSPSFTFNIKVAKGEAYRNRTGDFMIAGEMKPEDSYTLEFYSTPNGEDLFARAYNKNIFINYEEDDKDAKEKYNTYLQLPDNISKEVYNLVKNITKDCKNSSDKVKAIQTYLSANYKYTLDVPQPVGGKEFVENFLFKEKKGYCTYFATAATIMFRIAGIPARYVEGFNMLDKKAASGLYEVTNDLTHAWTEVLLNSDEDIWSIVDIVPGADQRISSLGQNLSSSNNNNESTKSDSRLTFQFFNRISLVKALIWIMLIIPIAIGIALFVRLVISLKERKRMLDSNSTIPLYYYVKNRIEFLYKGNKIPDDDFKWIDETENGELKDKLENLITAVYEEFYGNKAEIKIDKYEIYNFVETYIRKEKGKIKYYILKVIGI